MADKPDKLHISPFSNLKIASHEVLRGLERRPCPKCNASRKYYCYVCYVTVGVNRSLIPTVHLPIKVDIIKHQRELVGKSTATHARILAPNDVTIHNYPAVPECSDKEKAVVVFPAEDAITLKMISQNHDRLTVLQSSDNNSAAVFDRVVFIDSTWQQCHQIITDKKLDGLQRVKLENAVTHFWRPQRKKPDTCLATIEAIYYFFKEYDQHILKSTTKQSVKESPLQVSLLDDFEKRADIQMLSSRHFQSCSVHVQQGSSVNIHREYDGKYDNLLYFFAFQYNLIQEEQIKSKRKR